MKYLQIIKQMDVPVATKAADATPLRHEIDEIDEMGCTDPGSNSSISSISLHRDVLRRDESADAAVATLRHWYSVGALDTLPERIPGFAGELVQYSDRACLIGLVKAILDSVSWSLTAQDRAVQFVTVLTPLIEGGTA